MKSSNRQGSNRAAVDNNYMLTVLTGSFSQHENTSQPACQ
ncbi:Transposase, IS4 [Richelia intracellularis]|nr:Transposase, IS4 [Richelia intracellularis]